MTTRYFPRFFCYTQPTSIYASKARPMAFPRRFFLVLPLLLLGVGFGYYHSRRPPLPNPLSSTIAAAQETVCDENDAKNWCQLQHNTRRSGYSPNNIDWPISNAWAFGFAQSNLNRGRKPERLYPQTQPVVANGRLFIGTQMGTFYAFNAQTGAILWEYNNNQTLGPVLGTAGVAGNRVFFGSMDSKIYALDAQTGTVAWIFDSHLRSGFSTAVLLTEGRVFIGHESGVFFALEQSNGEVVWQTQLPANIFMSSAYDGGLLYVAANNLKLYALHSTNGSIEWETPAGLIAGAAFKDYWPLVHNGFVFVRPLKLYGGIAGNPALPRTTGLYSQSVLDGQQSIIDNYVANPGTKNLYVFNKLTGQEIVMPHFTANTMNGATCPPSIDGDGYVIGPALWNSTWGSGWSRLDANSKRIVEVLWDGNQYSTNPDENSCTSGAGRLIFISHVQEGNVARSWTWHLDNRINRLTPAYHADSDYFFNNIQGAGTTPSVIANGMIYHTTENTLNARRATVLTP